MYYTIMYLLRRMLLNVIDLFYRTYVRVLLFIFDKLINFILLKLYSLSIDIQTRERTDT